MIDLKPEPKLNFKIVIVGESGVGKTNLLSRYVSNKFFIGQNNTIGIEFSSKIITIRDTLVKVQLWDTAGQQRYRALASAFYKNSVGALIVFDLSCRETFERLGKWIQEIREQAAVGLALMLAGNKSDIEKREVTTQQALQFAQQQHMAYVETSACTGSNVNSAFDKLFEEIYDQYQQNAKQNPEQCKPQPVDRKSLVNLEKSSSAQNKKSCC